MKHITVKEMILCALFAELLALGAFIKIPGPIVPITMQILFVNLAGFILGKRLGTLSVGIYVVLGLVGFPVFTGGGGLGYLLKPTFGYLLGFVLGTFLCGCISEKIQGFKGYLLASFTSLISVYLLGMAYYYFLAMYYFKTEVGAWTLVLNFCLMFLPGDAVWCVVSGLLARRLKSLFTKV